MPVSTQVMDELHRWSRGLRRRARRLWRERFELSAADIERLAACFAAAGLACGAPDESCATTWRRTLLAFGFRAEAQRLSLSRGIPSTDHRALAAQHQRLVDVLQRVASLFEGNLQSLPTTLAAHDPRRVAVLDWARALRPPARIADLGCGAGRFLDALRQERPHARLWGLDLAPAMLAQCRRGVTRVAASLLNLPLGDGAFDAVFSVEALEHALRPQAAVMEMLRVLRPGGRLLIIDKNRELQSRCEHEPWERWFALDEVADWLAPHARLERCELLPSDGQAVAPRLFCCWTAIKHE